LTRVSVDVIANQVEDVMPVSFKPFAASKKTVVHVPDEVSGDRPQSEQPLPLDRRIRLDARIRAECVEIVSIDDLKPNARNAKKHPRSAGSRPRSPAKTGRRGFRATN
jgi:hypothetical protein